MVKVYIAAMVKASELKVIFRRDGWIAGAKKMDRVMSYCSRRICKF